MAEEKTKNIDLLEVLKKVVKTGKIKIGVNEVTKAIERGQAKYVLLAEDVNPKEITMHIPGLCKNKEIPFYKITSKTILGKAAGINVGTAAVAIIEEGDQKKVLSDLNEK